MPDTTDDPIKSFSLGDPLLTTLLALTHRPMLATILAMRHVINSATWRALRIVNLMYRVLLMPDRFSHLQLFLNVIVGTAKVPTWSCICVRLLMDVNELVAAVGEQLRRWFINHEDATCGSLSNFLDCKHELVGELRRLLPRHIFEKCLILRNTLQERLSAIWSWTCQLLQE